jgi:ABC-type Zn uptake system ZnuABC Zn-binding protein ZnuA
MCIRSAIHPIGSIRKMDGASPRRFKASFPKCGPETQRISSNATPIFDKRLSEAEKRWDAAMASHRRRKVITYHRPWPNFCERFGLVVVDYIEPRPGIPPTPSHTLEVINTMKRDNIKLIMVEAYFDMRTPNAIG